MFEITKDGNQLIFCPQIDVVAENVPQMRSELLKELEKDTNWQTFVFDCRKINHLDSIGVNLIVGILKKVWVYQKQMKLTQCTESIIKVLYSFRLDQQFVVEGRDA